MGRPPMQGYDAARAGRRARRLARKARRARKLDRESGLWRCVRRLLAKGFSPQQISRTLHRKHPDEPAWHVSHETIYTAIYAAPRGALRRELVALLRQHKCARRPRGQGANRRGRMHDLPSIHDRPPEANERLLPGHWEGDFIKGARNQSSVGVLVCRKTLFLKLVKMDGCSAEEALEGFSRAFTPLPESVRKTLTYDQGKEMALHKTLSRRTGLRIYFADPHSPWQRGICENTNGLLRQYLPKGTDLSVHSQRALDAIARQLNTRPRATLDYHCPAEMFMRALGRDDLAQAIDDALLD
jgi:IS30 family transposase